MRRSLLSRWLGVVILSTGLGLAPAMVGEATAAPIPAVGDRDGDGVADADDACPDMEGTLINDDVGFEGCVRVGQVVYQVLTGNQVSGQVVPFGMWRGQDVCRTGIEATLRARWYTDHDPATEADALTEVTTSDPGGFFAFEAELPFGTEYSVEVSPRLIVGDQAYCASAHTEVERYVDVVSREVAATYKSLTGTVTGRAVVLPGSSVEQPCSDLQTATLLRRFDDRSSEEIKSTTFLGADETFSIEAGPLVDGASYYVEVAERGPAGFPDVCRPARVDITATADADDDGVGDVTDACPRVAGPVGGDVPGCAVVERQLSADYDGGRAFGELTVVSFPPGTSNPCQLAMRIELWTVDDTGRRVTLVTSGLSSGGLDQTYSLPVDPPLPNGTRYVVATEQVPQTEIALCGAAQSKPQVSDDRDGDGVPDGSDACRTVSGPAPTGCPTVTRAVTASYRAGRLTGKVSVASLGGAPAGACSSPARLQVWQIGADGARVPLGPRVLSSADGSFSIDLALDAGTTVQVSALVSGDTGVALCAAANSPEVVAYGDRDDDTVPDADDDCPDVAGLAGSAAAGTAGCPSVQRTVEASYAVGTVSGTVRPIGSGLPAGACTGAPVAVSYAGPGGGQVRYDGIVGSTGAFEVEVGRPAVGSTLTVTLDAYDHDEVAFCPAVQPATTVTVASDRDDDGVPDTSDRCQDVKGPSRLVASGCPDLPRRLDTRYVDGVLSGSVALVDPEAAPPGACSEPSMVSAVRFEGQPTRDDLWSGPTDAAGTFAAPVGPLAHQTTYTVHVDDYLDPDAGLCLGAEDSQVFLDRDGDTFGDGADACPDYDGPAVGAPGYSAAFRGCRLVDLGVTAAYADRHVSGRLTVTGPADAPAGACRAAAQVRVTRLDGDVEGVELGRGETSPQDGTYAVHVGDLPTGSKLRVTTFFPQLVVAGISACGPSRSEVVEIADGDGDSVPDHADECPGVPAGPVSELRAGCPTLARLVTVKPYAGGAVSGEVRLVATNAPEGACLPAKVDVYRVVPGVPATWLASDTTDAEGRFDIALDAPLDAGTAIQVVAPAFQDGDVADCRLAESAGVEVPQPDLDGDGVADRDDLCDGVAAPNGYQGCPKVEQGLTAKYDVSGVMTGRLRVVNPDLSPGACLSATVQLLRTGADGVPAVVASQATEADGSYRIVLAQPLAAGDVYFAVVPSRVDRELAFCAGGQSAARVAPVIPAVR